MLVFFISLIGAATSAVLSPMDPDKMRHALSVARRDPLFDKCLAFAKKHGTEFLTAMYNDISEESWGPYVLFIGAALLMGILFCVTGKFFKMIIKVALSWLALAWMVVSISPIRVAVGAYLVGNQ